MRPVNYDIQQYRNYARGRALPSGQLNTWIAAFAARLPGRRPLSGLDLGSGTGRFTPALAAAFGPAVGVEPSARMRQIAQTQAAHPDVTYLSGSAEAIPLPDSSIDYAVLFLVWHHVADQARAARELARVIRPGGTLLLRSQFRDRMPWVWWLEFFPGGFEADAAMYGRLDEVVAVLGESGWEMAGLAAIDEPPAGTRADLVARLRLQPYSIFEQLTADEIGEGFRRLEAAVAADPQAPPPPSRPTLLTLTRR
jgi:SAM-dependent methyltransferase